MVSSSDEAPHALNGDAVYGGWGSFWSMLKKLMRYGEGGDFLEQLFSEFFGGGVQTDIVGSGASGRTRSSS